MGDQKIFIPQGAKMITQQPIPKIKFLTAPNLDVLEMIVNDYIRKHPQILNFDIRYPEQDKDDFICYLIYLT